MWASAVFCVSLRYSINGAGRGDNRAVRVVDSETFKCRRAEMFEQPLFCLIGVEIPAWPLCNRRAGQLADAFGQVFSPVPRIIRLACRAAGTRQGTIARFHRAIRLRRAAGRKNARSRYRPSLSPTPNLSARPPLKNYPALLPATYHR